MKGFHLLLLLSSCVICHSFIQPKLLIHKPMRINPSTSSLHGIPKLFRWLIDLYPLVLDSVRNGLSSSNAMKIDNFYLDMNGIIHSCTHSNNDKLIEFNEVLMFQRIFTYTDNLYKLVKPSKMMFLAVDGVAPRAKMNQQRSRRFRSSKEREMLISEYVAKEGTLPAQESFDSNCITPGTQFMHRLGVAFRSWIQYKMDTDDFWKANGATVIFSGPDVPGEGEHKVMDMIRSIQADEDKTGYQIGSLRHCMYGLDADLIMLSLATHEPHFVLLREKITRRKNQLKSSRFSSEDFELLEITLLRAMLKQHFRKIPKLDLSFSSLKILSPSQSASIPTKSTVSDKKDHDVMVDKTSPIWKKTGVTPSSDAKSIERENRIIDDFIFLCFFIGNDFLPSLPHLDISDGSLTYMMDTYRDMIPSLGGYLTHDNQLHLARIELFIQEISRREALYFQHRAAVDKEPEFNTPQYKEYYYQSKFGIQPGDHDGVRRVVEAYVQGLAWVLTYYKHGCGSWTWYYPYLYAPLASDIINIHDMIITFEVGVPFTPLLQLLSVLPPQSGKFLPSSYEEVMTSDFSPLQAYYPKDFEVDANGKKNAWECVVKIPFIDEEVLVDTISMIDHDAVLTDEEKSRNTRGTEYSQSPSSSSSSNKDHYKEQRQGRWGNALVDDIRSRNPTSPRTPYTPKNNM